MTFLLFLYRNGRLNYRARANTPEAFSTWAALAHHLGETEAIRLARLRMAHESHLHNWYRVRTTGQRVNYQLVIVEIDLEHLRHLLRDSIEHGRTETTGIETVLTDADRPVPTTPQPAEVSRRQPTTRKLRL